ncbi:MAG: FAD-dependent oxidoreductase [Cypionkella sp.]|uniref:FAD-dependent oxidoreductase n=1 Tax=Cypionkella sp. TaxID=2811411 RepID=UPI002ABC64E0|nr:FAD-dependent oxidoreductase [Cypionkella sp.]MDZ4311465.1 FAD-dependent oxidoreductase [Cypionkella sp.]
MSVQFEMASGAAILTFNNPPLNVVGKALRVGLAEALERAVAAGAERIILTGAGQNFAAGADAKEFDHPAQPPHLNDVLASLVMLPIPTIAAIHGAALGGGLEIALACRYRIATSDAMLGLPEVTLGIIPGAGGTQRLPRLIGLKAALDLIWQGRRISGAEALALGAIDAVSDDPLAAAKALGNDVLGKALNPDFRPAPTADPEAVASALAQAKKRAFGQIAPPLAIQMIADSASQTIETALLRERQIFLELRASDQARALRHVFFAERSAQSQGKSYPAPKRDINAAIVVGGGTMGAAIAYTLALVGIAVTVVETDTAGQSRAKANVTGLIAQGVARGTLTQARADAVTARINFTIGYTDLPPVDLAIEAAFENMAVKQTIFAALQAALPETTILASNTSYLDVNIIAQGISTPGRFLGLHFFAPAHIMKLLEIVKATQTASKTLAATFGLAKRLGKIPVLAGVCDGFIGNRILTRYRQAADLELLNGAQPKDVDQIMQKFGLAMGPYLAQDMSGLDIAYANRQRQNLRHRTDLRYVTIADTLVEDLKRLGCKTNAGWYDYDAGEAKPSARVAACIAAASAKAGILPQASRLEDIAERLMLAMISEAVAILDEGIAARPQDIDLVMVHGYGFPRWRGGLMHYADSLGPTLLVERLERLTAKDPLSWSVPPLLRKLAHDGRSIDSLNHPGAKP